MKKILKSTIIILLVALTIVPCMSVYAETEKVSDMTVNNKTYIYVGDESTGTRREAKFGTNKGYAYCITPEATGVNNNTTLQYIGEEVNGGVLYLLDNAKADDHSYLITQLAIWKYANNFIPAFYLNNSDLEILKEVDNLVAEAEKHKNYSVPSASVHVDVNSASAKFTKFDEEYLISGVFKANITNGQSTSYELKKAPNGSMLVNEAGEKINSLKNGDEFYILVPKTELEGKTVKFELNVTAKGIAKRIERYSTGDSKWQDLVIITSGETYETHHIEFTTYYEEEKITCEKVDGKYYGKDGKETDKETYLTECETHKCANVDGTYFDKDGKITDEETYEKQCFKHVCEKIDGNYFDANGNIATYDEYRTQCETLVCEVVNGKYFGAYGKEVTENEFKSQCEAQIVSVPDTKVTSIISMIIGFVMLVGVVLFARKQANN